MEDDGNGKPRTPGRGMRNMMARAAQLNGAIDWTWEGQGCLVMFEFPAAPQPDGQKS